MLSIYLDDIWIDSVETGELGLGCGRGVVIGVLVIDRRDRELGPVGRLHLLPQPERLEPPVEHPLGLALLGADVADGVLVQTLGSALRLDFGRPAMLPARRAGRRFAGLAALHVGGV